MRNVRTKRLRLGSSGFFGTLLAALAGVVAAILFQTIAGSLVYGAEPDCSKSPSKSLCESLGTQARLSRQLNEPLNRLGGDSSSADFERVANDYLEKAASSLVGACQVLWQIPDEKSARQAFSSYNRCFEKDSSFNDASRCLNDMGFQVPRSAKDHGLSAIVYLRQTSLTISRCRDFLEQGCFITASQYQEKISQLSMTCEFHYGLEFGTSSKAKKETAKSKKQGAAPKSVPAPKNKKPVPQPLPPPAPIPPPVTPPVAPVKEPEPPVHPQPPVTEAPQPATPPQASAQPPAPPSPPQPQVDPRMVTGLTESADGVALNCENPAVIEAAREQSKKRDYAQRLRGQAILYTCGLQELKYLNDKAGLKFLGEMSLELSRQVGEANNYEIKAQESHGAISDIQVMEEGINRTRIWLEAVDKGLQGLVGSPHVPQEGIREFADLVKETRAKSSISLGMFGLEMMKRRGSNYDRFVQVFCTWKNAVDADRPADDASAEKKDLPTFPTVILRSCPRPAPVDADAGAPTPPAPPAQ